jgi:glycosyltransferase involved in cell wall biosynthesis
MSKIEFIIPTYERTDHLMCIISSIRAQRTKRWKIHVVADCPPEGTLDKIMDYFKDDYRIKFTILPERYNDWGHTPRNYGLEHATEDWVIMSGEDNYYTPVFVDNMLDQALPHVHFVYCNMVHNWTNFQYYPIECQPSWGKIDIGNFMVRREYAQQMKLDVTNMQADGKFVEEYLERFPLKSTAKVNKFLYIHN